MTDPFSFLTFEDGGNGSDFIVSKILLKDGDARFYAVDHNGNVKMDRTLPPFLKAKRRDARCGICSARFIAAFRLNKTPGSTRGK